MRNIDVVNSSISYALEALVFILIGVLILIALSVWIIRLIREKRALDHKTVIVDHKPVLDAIEGLRDQNSNEHSWIQEQERAQSGMLRQLLDRFGFLRKIK